MDIARWLQHRIAERLQVPEEAIDIRAPFARFGIDSVEALTITVELEEQLGRRLPTTLVWDYPTIAQVAQLLHGEGSALPPPPAATHAGATQAIDPATYDITRFREYRDLRFRLRLSQVPTIGNPYYKMTSSVGGDTITIHEREYLNFATYNYLGLSGHPRLIEAARAASSAYGTSVSASRTTSGEKPVHRALEQQIAKLLQVDEAVCFVGGHATNVSFLGEFVGEEDLILHDELAHDSILQGAKLSGAARVPFRHSDVRSAEAFLREHRGRYRRVLLAVEGVYSTDGDIAPIRELIALKRQYGALLMVDEAHSIGVLGRRGGGLREHAEIAGSDVDVWMGTLSKAFASCGGYIAGSRALVELVKYTSPGFLYSAGMTPANAAMALEAIRVMREESSRVRELHQRADFFRGECQRHGLDTGFSAGSPVVPVLVGDTIQCLRLAQALFRRGIHVTPMVHPAVRDDGARLRFFLSSLHTEAQLQEAAAATAAELASIRARFPGSFAPRRVLRLQEPKNAAIAREGFGAFSRGDIKALTDQLDTRSRYFFAGRSAVAGVHHGPDAILEFLVSLFALTDGTHALTVEEILSDATHGIVIFHNVAYRGEQRVETLACEISDIEGETVTAATIYLQEQAAFDEVLGCVQPHWARPVRDLHAVREPEGEAARTLQQGFAALLRGEAVSFFEEGATLAMPPQLRGAGAPLRIAPRELRAQLGPLYAAGCTFAVDLAVVGARHAVSRAIVCRGDEFLGTLCLVAEHSGGTVHSAWLAADADLRQRVRSDEEAPRADLS